MLDLRPYQHELITAIRREVANGNRRVLAVGGCGMGKTTIFCSLAHAATGKGKVTWIIVHRRELLEQASRSLTAHGVAHGFIAAGYPVTPAELTQVSMVQSLAKRLATLTPPDHIVIDEVHLALAKTYRTVTDAYPAAVITGWTATPCRTDGRGLGELFDVIVEGPSTQYLTDEGYLAPIRAWAPPVLIDMRGVTKRGGDYAPEDLAKRANKPSVTGNAIQTWLKLAKGKRTAIFCATIHHAEAVAADYNAAGIPSAVLHGKLSQTEREAVSARLASGEIHCVMSCQLLIEGWDLPSLEVVQCLRPTGSRIVHVQMLGRVSRPAPEKSFGMVLDHAGNILRHGLPTDPVVHSLEGKAKTKAPSEPLNMLTCKRCFALFRPGLDACPECGAVLPKPKPKPPIRVIPGELQELIANPKTADAASALAACRNRADLMLYAKARGYLRGWAHYTAIERNLTR